jgi:hypothetical protein
MLAEKVNGTEPCPIMADEVYKETVKKCEFQRIREFLPKDIVCGNGRECFLRKVPEVKRFASGTKEDQRIKLLSDKEVGIILKAIFRDLMPQIYPTENFQVVFA